jgi:hypothetical protein
MQLAPRRPTRGMAMTSRTTGIGVVTILGLAAVPVLITRAAASRTTHTVRSADARVTICHATGSRSHPYVRISPSVAGVVNGHLKHQDHRDIVPPFTFRGHSYAQNWTPATAQFLAAGCTVATGPTGPGTL